MERVDQASGDHVRPLSVLEEYLRLAEAYEGNPEGFFFDTGAWCETLTDSYLAVGRVDDAVRLVGDGVAAGAQCPLLVRLRGQVQALLQPPGVTTDAPR